MTAIVVGEAIEIEDCNGSTGQSWTISPDVQTGAFRFKHVLSGRCLDVPGGSTADGARLDSYDCLGGPNQKFKLQAY